MTPRKYMIKYIQLGTESLKPHSLIIFGIQKSVKLRETELSWRI